VALIALSWLGVGLVGAVVLLVNYGCYPGRFLAAAPSSRSLNGSAHALTEKGSYVLAAFGIMSLALLSLMAMAVGLAVELRAAEAIQDNVIGLNVEVDTSLQELQLLNQSLTQTIAAVDGYDQLCGQNTLSKQLRADLRYFYKPLRSIAGFLNALLRDLDAIQGTVHQILVLVSFVIPGALIFAVGVWTCFVLALIFAFRQGTERQCGTFVVTRRLFIGLGIAGVWLFWTLLGVLLSADVLTADFCMNPPNNTLGIVTNHSSSTYAILEYYITCVPPAPPAPAISDYLDEMKGEVVKGQIAVAALRVYSVRCTGAQSYFNAMTAGLNAIDLSLDALRVLNDCQIYNPIYQQIAYDNVCGQAGASLFQGLLISWCGVLALAFFTSLAFPLFKAASPTPHLAAAGGYIEIQ
jgi:hypothetical protein